MSPQPTASFSHGPSSPTHVLTLQQASAHRSYPFPSGSVFEGFSGSVFDELEEDFDVDVLLALLFVLEEDLVDELALSAFESSDSLLLYFLAEELLAMPMPSSSSFTS